MKIFTLFILLFQITIFTFTFSLFGHSGTIWQLQINGKYLYSSASDGVVNVWDKDSNNLLLSIYSHNSWARALFVDEKFIIVGGYKPDGNLKIYDKKTGKLIKLFHSEGSIFTIYANKNYIVFGGSDNKVYIINRETLKLIDKHSFHSRWIRDLIIINNQLISCGDDGKVIIYDIYTHTLINSISLSGRIIKLLNINQKIYAVSNLGKIYDLNSKKVVFSLNNFTSASADGKFIYTGNNLGELYILNTKFELIDHLKIAIDSIISIASTSNLIFIGTSGGKIIKYNLKDNSIINFLNNFSLIKKIFIDGKYLYVLKNSGTLISYDIETGKNFIKNFSDNITNIFVQNGNIYYSTSENKVISPEGNVIFESENGISLIFKFKNLLFLGTFGEIYVFKDYTLENYIEIPNSWPISYYIGKEKIKIGTNTGEIIEYDIETSEIDKTKISNSPIVKILEGNIYVNFDGTIYNNKSLILKINHNIFDGELFNNHLIFGTEDGITIFNMKTKKISEIQSEYPVVSIVEKNKFLYVSLSNGDIDIFDEKFKEYGKLTEEELKIVTVDLSSDGNYVVTGGADKKVKLWKVENKNLILQKSFAGHNDWIRTIKFIGSNLIASGSSDNTIKIWNYDGKLIKTLSYHSGYVWTLEYKDGILYSGGWDNRLFAYDLNHEKLIFETKFKAPITCIKLFDNKLIISFINGEIGALNLNDLKYEKLFSAESTIWSFDIYDKYLAAGNEQGECFLYDLKKSKIIKKFQAHRTTIFSIKLANNKIITASSDNTIKIFDFEGNLKGMVSDFTLSVLAIAIDPIRNYIITSSGKNPIILQIP